MNYSPTLDAAILFEEVWQKEFEPVVREKRRQLNERRTEAFLDVTLPLCGEQVRQLTALDMLHLDALENPFIAGSSDGVQFIDCAGFIWQLHAENNHTPSIRNLWRRRHVVQRLARLSVLEMAIAINAFVDRMLLDPAPPRPPAPGESVALKDEPKTHFLAPLIAEVAASMGHLDPVNGQLLAHIPLPRLLQYRDCYREEKGEKVYTEIHSLRNRCMERVNQIRAAAFASIPSTPSIPSNGC